MRLPTTLAVLLLAGCTGGLGAPVPPGGRTLAGPPGYCPVEGTLQDRGGSVFVAFARCASQGLFQSQTADAVLTATIGAEGSALEADLSPAAMRLYFSGRDGLAALSRTGNPAAVQVHDISVVDSAVVVRLTDRSAGRPDAIGEGESWRAVLETGGRLVTLTVQARRDVALSVDDGRELIRGFVRAMRNTVVG